MGSGDLWNWISSSLSNQCICVDGQVSTLLPVVSGVPQDSLLGPLFYIIFINNLFDSIAVARPFTYADNTKLLMVMENSFNSASRLKRTLMRSLCGVLYGTYIS